MDKNFMKPDEVCEGILTEVKKELDVKEEMDTNSAGALVTLMNLEKLSEAEFISTNLNIITEDGRKIGKSLLEKDYPLDALTVMEVLFQLFGEKMGENDAMMMTDMILTCNEKGIEELVKLAEEFDKEQANGESTDEEE